MVARKVTLVVAFGFWSQHFWRWQGPMNAILSFYDCRLSDGDTGRWWGHSHHTCFFALTGGGDAKTSCSCPHAPLPSTFIHLCARIRATWWNFHYLVFIRLDACKVVILCQGNVIHTLTRWLDTRPDTNRSISSTNSLFVSFQSAMRQKQLKLLLKKTWFSFIIGLE